MSVGDELQSENRRVHMRRFIVSRRVFVSLAIALVLIAGTLGISLFTSATSSAAAGPAYVSLSQSYISAPAGARLTGAHASNAQLTVTLVLQPNNVAKMNSLLTALYTPGTAQYHHWLAQGQFNRLFAPSASQVAQVRQFLTNAGLKIIGSPSPFFVRATGTTAQVEAAFRTPINNYTTTNGKTFFQNDSAIQIPASLSAIVTGVSGLYNTVRLQPSYVTSLQAAKQQGKKVAPRYGAGPGGSGLTPSQTSSLYDATPVYQLGSRGQGKGAILAVFELSGYTESDIVAYEHQFFGPSENVKIANINVDGGPANPQCPVNDECGPTYTGPGGPDYSGDIEVEADVETQIAIAPKISHLIVYNAPNDVTGQTSLDEYAQIANDDLADSISSSWGLCELDAGFGYAQAENVLFEQMAAQGQSMFNSAGDTGAWGCLRDTGSPNLTSLSTGDPASQPFVTSVGGTSFGTYDPGSTLHPSYPKGAETVWNVLDLCNSSDLNACAQFGAGGGGVSQFWAQPSYQHGPGVISSFSKKGPYCAAASKGQYCRETPDVSANADEYTPYAEYCTGDPTTNSTCALLASLGVPEPVPGWFGIGGTSLSSPLWSGIIALWDSVHGERFGNANFGLYRLFRSGASYSVYFHDITGKHQTENNNGFYPTTPDYDMATGIGTPIIAGIVERSF